MPACAGMTLRYGPRAIGLLRASHGMGGKCGGKFADFGLAFLASAWYNSVRFVRKGAFLTKIPGTRKERCNVRFP
jgi:hypothetical protein